MGAYLEAQTLAELRWCSGVAHPGGATTNADDVVPKVVDWHGMISIPWLVWNRYSHSSVGLVSGIERWVWYCKDNHYLNNGIMRAK